MATRGAGPWLLLLSVVLCAAAAEPRCPSCAAGAERRLLEEAAKRQLLEKLRLRDRPRLVHAVPRAAVARALRRLQAGSTRRGPDDDDGEEQSYEIISFAQPGGRHPRGPRRGWGALGCARCQTGWEGARGDAHPTRPGPWAPTPRSAGAWGQAGGD